MLRTFLFPCLSLVALGSAGQTKASDPLKAALDASPKGPVYSYQLDLRVNDFEGRARIHPNRPNGSRVVMQSPKRADLNSEQRQGLKDIDAEALDDFWCHSFARRIPRTGVTLVSQTAAIATYRFKPVPDGTDSDDIKLMKHLTGTVTVDKKRPAILSFALTAPRSFKPVIVARVDTFELKAQCGRTPDGRTYVTTFDLNVKGSAMLQSFEDRQQRRHSNLRRIDG